MAGFVVYEAAAFCRPIIAFDIEWHSEFFEHGINGILVENRNIVKLAEAVIGLLKDTERANRLGMMARQKMDRKHDPEIIAREQVREYLELLGI